MSSGHIGFIKSVWTKAHRSDEQIAALGDAQEKAVAEANKTADLLAKKALSLCHAQSPHGTQQLLELALDRQRMVCNTVAATLKAFPREGKADRRDPRSLEQRRVDRAQRLARLQREKQDQANALHSHCWEQMSRASWRCSKCLCHHTAENRSDSLALPMAGCAAPRIIRQLLHGENLGHKLFSARMSVDVRGDAFAALPAAERRAAAEHVRYAGTLIFCQTCGMFAQHRLAGLGARCIGPPGETASRGAQNMAAFARSVHPTKPYLSLHDVRPVRAILLAGLPPANAVSSSAAIPVGTSGTLPFAVTPAYYVPEADTEAEQATQSHGEAGTCDPAAALEELHELEQSGARVKWPQGLWQPKHRLRSKTAERAAPCQELVFDETPRFFVPCPPFAEPRLWKDWASSGCDR